MLSCIRSDRVGCWQLNGVHWCLFTPTLHLKSRGSWTHFDFLPGIKSYSGICYDCHSFEETQRELEADWLREGY
eukprot:COSAG02_NODE_6357_length_3627_cov_11.172052_3_plen_74_part_00